MESTEQIKDVNSSKERIPIIFSMLGLIFFILASSSYLFFRNNDLSAILILTFFVLSLLSSWTAVAYLKFTKEGGVIEIMSWSIAMLDSIVSIVLILLFLFGSSFYEWGV
jgi:hypothetical protein